MLTILRPSLRGYTRRICQKGSLRSDGARETVSLDAKEISSEMTRDRRGNCRLKPGREKEIKEKKRNPRSLSSSRRVASFELFSLQMRSLTTGRVKVCPSLYVAVQDDTANARSSL